MLKVNPRLYRVAIELSVHNPDPEGVGITFLQPDVREWLLESVNDTVIADGVEGVEGLFDFYVPEADFDLLGDWQTGVMDSSRGLLQIKDRAKVLIWRLDEDSPQRLVFIGYVKTDGLEVTEQCPGFSTTKVNCVNHAAILKEIRIGKNSTYVNPDYPSRTFDLYKKTERMVPEDVVIPDGASEEWIKEHEEDVEIYIKSDTYFENDALQFGDISTFKRVALFDSITGADSIEEDVKDNANHAYFKPLRNGYNQVSGVIKQGWYSWGLPRMKNMSLTEMVQDALKSANRHLEVVGKENWPRFELRGVAPSLNYRGAIALETGVWHVGYQEHLGRSFVFLWKSQWEVTIYEITSGFILTEIGSYTYTAPPDEIWMIENTYTYPNLLQSWITEDRARNPQKYVNYHPDGTLAASMLGVTGEDSRIWFGWIALRPVFPLTDRRRGRMGDDGTLGNLGFYTNLFHAVSIDIDTGVVEQASGVSPLGYAGLCGRSEVMQEYEYGVYYIPTITSLGVVSDEVVPITEVSLPDEYLLRESPYRSISPLGNYSRIGNTFAFEGDVFTDQLAFSFEDTTTSKIIELICKLTNSAPVISFSEDAPDKIYLSFRQREESVPNPETRPLFPQQILNYQKATEQYGNKEEIPTIDLPLLNNLPDAFLDTVNEYYRGEFFRKGLVLHQHTIPLIGEMTPSWAGEARPGDFLSWSGKTSTIRRIEPGETTALIISEEYL
jgi:hypothetical protein